MTTRSAISPIITLASRTASKTGASGGQAKTNDDEGIGGGDGSHRATREWNSNDLDSTKQNYPPLNVAVDVTERRLYRHESFPEKLYRLLTETQLSGKDHIVSWTPCDKAFEIHQPEAFEKEIIPLYFRHSRIASFRRQLSMYGFRRATLDNGLEGFAHEQFHRDHPEACASIRRTSEIHVEILPSNATESNHGG